MTGFSDYAARRTLDHWNGKTAAPTLVTPGFLALLTAAFTSDAGTGGTEVSGGSYARSSVAAAAWNAAGGSGPASADNASPITFATPTADWGAVLAWAYYDAVSGGNMLYWDYLGAFEWRPFTCTNASPGVLTVPGHGYSNGDKVVVSAEYGGALPATGGSWSGLLTVANVTTDTFTVGVNTTGTGNGMVRKVVPQVISTNVVGSFAAGALVVKLA